MADIFLSYAREDEARAAKVVQVLGELGWSVFWDRRIVAGTSWDDVVEREIRASKCVIVLWSVASVASRWVKTEARFGLQREALVPACLDQSEPPLEFRFLEAAQLQAWSGDADHPEFRVLTAGIAQHVEPGLRERIPERMQPSAPPALSVHQEGADTRADETLRTSQPLSTDLGPGLPWPRPWRVGFDKRWIAIASVAAGVVVVMGLVLLRSRGSQTIEPAIPSRVVATTPATTASTSPTSEKAATRGSQVGRTNGRPEQPAVEKRQEGATGSGDLKAVVDQLVVQEESFVVWSDAPFNNEIAIYVGQVDDGAGLTVVLPTQALADYFAVSSARSRLSTVAAIGDEAHRLVQAQSPLLREQSVREFVQGRCLADRVVAWNGVPWLQFEHRGIGYELLLQAAVSRGHGSQLAFRILKSDRPGNLPRELCSSAFRASAPPGDK